MGRISYTWSRSLITVDGDTYWQQINQGITYPANYDKPHALNLEGNLLKKKVAHGSWMLAVYNLTGRRNAYSIYFKNENGMIRGYKLSVYGVLIFTISYNFKLGNYAVD